MQYIISMTHNQGRSWGLWGPGVGCTHGPCLKSCKYSTNKQIEQRYKLNNISVFFKFVGVKVQKPNYQT